MLPRNYTRESGSIVGWVQSNLKYFLRVATWNLREDPEMINSDDLNRLALIFRHSYHSSCQDNLPLCNANPDMLNKGQLPFTHIKQWFETRLGWCSSYYPIPEQQPKQLGGDVSNRSIPSAHSMHSLSPHAMGSFKPVKETQKALVIHGIARQTKFLSCPPGANVHISTCEDSTIYLTTPCE